VSVRTRLRAWRGRHPRTTHLALAGIAFVFAGLLAAVVINAYVVTTANHWIMARMSDVPHSQAAIVFGAAVYEGGALSQVTSDRVAAGIALYQAGKVDKLLISGDHGQMQYNEVTPMRDMALAAGVPPRDVFTDHAGFCTYDTIARATRVFKVDRAVLVTQRYHLPRALYLARELGLPATGFEADQRQYRSQRFMTTREYAARVKDFVKAIFRPDPRFLGAEIPITGDGRVTDDRIEMQEEAKTKGE
jgi:SanA protein